MNDALSAKDFPPGFQWGVATAAYQVEGAYKEDGRGMSIWDIFSHEPGKTANGDTGDVADDNYHRYEEDIRLMKNMGVDYYRFSISWSRILPTGELPTNPAGIEHYNTLIDLLLKYNITPFITLYHWDIPQALDVKYGGWLNTSMADYFALYADVCFANFGDRVKRWLTFNEPLSFCWIGYGSGVHAPGRCSDRSQCAAGNTSTEPYLCTHSVLLSHAAAVQVLRQKYSKQGAEIGITLNCDWAEPNTTSPQDLEASHRHLEFQLAWFADPVFFGDYPEVMKKRVGDRLPKFTEQQKQLLKGSHDFFGFNHYTSEYIAEPTYPPSGEGWSADEYVVSTRERDGKLIGPQADSNWLYVVPWGIRKNLKWIYDRYRTPIYITENGVDVPNESSIPLPTVLKDQFRVDFYKSYIAEVLNAINDGVDVRSYTAWSILDNFEWADGFTKRFGLHYVDYKNGLTRYPKDSALWFKSFINATVIM